MSPGPKLRAGIALVGLSVLVAGFYAAAVLFVWLLEWGLSGFWWFAPLLFFFPFVWLSPLAIPSLMIITVSSYAARSMVWKAYPPPKPPSSTPILSSRVFPRTWKKIRPAVLPIVLIALAFSFYYFTYTADHNAVQSIIVSMSVQSRHSSLNPPQANFTIFFYMNTLQPATEVTKIGGARFSLVVDSQPAGTFTMPYEGRVGGFEGRDVADYLQFDMTGSGASTVLQHNPNTLIITAQFSAQGYLVQQEVTRTFTISYDNRTSVLY